MLVAIPHDSTFGAEKPEPGGPNQISNQPRSRIAEAGTLVQFSVLVTNAGPSPEYQWQFNGTNINGATKRSFCIENVQMANVGTYTVAVQGKGSCVSDPAYLSVYTLGCSNSNQGTLQTPIGAFKTYTYSCGGGTFNRYYCPTNDNGYPALFYGPNADPQSGPFQNTSYSPTLTIDTFSPDNGAADTGLMFQNNFTPINPAVCCNDNAGGGIQSQCGPITLSVNSGSASNSYRLTLLYKVPPGPPTSGKITFNWLYQ
jgi:hypothetical protein